MDATGHTLSARVALLNGIVAPGRLPTAFDDHAVTTDRGIVDYQRTAVGNFRRLLAMGRFAPKIELAAAAGMIIAEADAPHPKRRLLVGRDALASV